MSKKIHQTIFRLGKIQKWDTKIVEKKFSDRAAYDSKILVIKNLLNKLFNNHDLNVASLKLFYNESKIHIFIEYFLAVEPKLGSVLKQIKVSPRPKREDLHKKQKLKILTKTRNKTFFKKQQGDCKKVLSLILFKRAFFFKNYFTETRGVNQKKFLLKLKNIFNLFDHKDHNLTFTLKQINKNSIKTLTKNKQKLLKQVVVQLRKYQNNEFFINSLNLFVNATNHKQNAARILSNLISAEITRLKRHTFFIRFMEAALLVIIKKRLSDVSGIKIQIKGRINGVPRAKTKYLIVGNSMTNFQIDSDLNYSEKVSHTKNGTLGVKVWVYY